MLILGLQGSPRKKGNTNYLLATFMTAAEKFGARTHVIHVTRKEIIPCKEYTVCEKKGYCPIEDDVKYEIYPLLREAELVVVATPIFFYNMTAQLKAVIDRCQTFWARKYKLKLKRTVLVVDDDYVTKPFDKDKLLARIKMLLRRGS